MRSSLAAVLVLLASGPVAAQSTTGTLTGIVTQSGEPLPGVTVTVASPNLQGIRSVSTNDAGAYNFGALPPGEYTVRFELQGLRTATRRVHVGVAQDARADAVLAIAALEESITVRAAPSSVATTTEVQTNFQQALIDELPVARNLTGITSLSPGVVVGVNGFQISGGMSFDNLYTVNGAVIQENLRGQPHNLFIEDAIQETTVQTAGVSAEFGNFTGGVVNAITRSGTNDFSGSLRDSVTNPRWTARSPDIFVDERGVPTRTSAPENIDERNHVWEATFGGRIVRDRLWFFVAGRQSENESERFLSNSTIPYLATTTDERREAKLTGAITPGQSIVASYMNSPLEQVNNCQAGCFDLESVDPFISFPNNFITAFYNGVFTSSALLEAKYTAVNFRFNSLGGDDGDLVTGTPINLLAPGFNTYTNAPPFSGLDTTDVRDNDSIGLKGSYFFGSRTLGSHNVTAGVERFHETRESNNHQSPTGFRIVSRTAPPQRGANGTLISLIPATGPVPRDFVWWFPIELQSRGSDLTTDALYLNDKWDLGSRWSFNLGLRFDRNDSTDSQGNKVADDRKISPRLGAAYEALANGRLRVMASYGTYVGRLAETVAGMTSAAGAPSQFAFAYEGPELRNLPPAEVSRRFFEWFEANGGTSRTRMLANVPGFTTRLAGTLVSPTVTEWTAGASTQLGRGYVRADYIHRDWNDFYAAITNRSTGTVTSPTGITNDLLIITNSNDLDRTYDAVELQAQWRMTSHVSLGGNYTWSQTKGNTAGEDTGGGPFAAITEQYYPEYRDFSWNNPTGFLPTDQTHTLRAWISAGFDTLAGRFNASVLQRFDSGSPYTLSGSIDIRQSSNFYGAGQPGGVPNPGYITPPTSVTYYFSGRGEFRFGNLTATDLALNYYTNPGWLAGTSFFVQSELLNVFNEDAATALNTAVITHLQDPSLKRFNPVAGDVPVEGIHWRKGTLFGFPTAPTTGQSGGSFQLPRTYRVSLGVRF